MGERLHCISKDRDHLVRDLQRDQGSLERSIRNDEAGTNSIEGMITEFESGDEVRSL